VTLPQPSGSLFIADGGMETTLIFRDGFDLPHFAAFTLLDHERGRAGLRAYYEPYLAVARDHGVGVVLDTPTWRANPELTVVGGCCGTDERHIGEMCRAVLAADDRFPESSHRV
jgi:homocysteine S-methyltransferase